MRGTNAQHLEEIASSPGFAEAPFERVPWSQTPATLSALAIPDGQMLPLTSGTAEASR
jgi:hypothetical protein